MNDSRMIEDKLKCSLKHHDDMSSKKKKKDEGNLLHDMKNHIVFPKVIK